MDENISTENITETPEAATEETAYPCGNFDPNDVELKGKVCKILVIGVGGAGNNAVNRMIDAEITSAEFAVANTDMQDLMSSITDSRMKILLGRTTTKGLGAGSNPSIGKKAAEESDSIIRSLLKDVNLLFITAGMGGGTGTGAAPVIARIAHEMDILTIAVVTTPFKFEGERRMAQAQAGINELSEYVDTLLVVPNEKLRDLMPKGTNLKEAFAYADEVLRQGVQGISDLIVKPALINRDFADVKTVLKEKGFAHIGIGVAQGERRVLEAVEKAVHNRLLETDISEATAAILFVNGGSDMSLDEVNEAGDLVREAMNQGHLIFGADITPEYENRFGVTIIATGFKAGGQRPQPRFTQSRMPFPNTQRPASVSQTTLPPMPERRPQPNIPVAPDESDGRIRVSDKELPRFLRGNKN
ncbi:MAG: cell division protein FtsZ [Clostridia bacterium]|nr:cell division protein FtsZ [Clostridia bacterium]